MVDVSSVLRVLAELAPDRREPSYEVATGTTTPIAWLGAFPYGDEPFSSSASTMDATLWRLPSTAEIEALVRFDALTPDAHDIRIGWAWVTGTATVDGDARRFCLPLLSRPVSIASPLLLYLGVKRDWSGQGKTEGAPATS